MPAGTPTTGYGASALRKPNCGWTTTASPTGAPNPDAAHAWIDWILIPEVSIKDLDYHGYNSGMKNMDQLLNELKPDLKYGDMIFFNDAQVKTMRTQEDQHGRRTAWSTSTTRSQQGEGEGREGDM